MRMYGQRRKQMTWDHRAHRLFCTETLLTFPIIRDAKQLKKKGKVCTEPIVLKLAHDFGAGHPGGLTRLSQGEKVPLSQH